MTPLKFREPTSDDFYPCAAEVNFGSAYTSYRCALGCGHSGPHRVECKNVQGVRDSANAVYDLTLIWESRS